MGKAESDLLDEIVDLYEDHGKGRVQFTADYRGFEIELEAGSLQQRVHLTFMSAVKGQAAAVGALPPFGPKCLQANPLLGFVFWVEGLVGSNTPKMFRKKSP
eukprot:5792940-Amphidinium_carterae.1